MKVRNLCDVHSVSKHGYKVHSKHTTIFNYDEVQLTELQLTQLDIIYRIKHFQSLIGKLNLSLTIENLIFVATRSVS